MSQGPIYETYTSLKKFKVFNRTLISLERTSTGTTIYAGHRSNSSTNDEPIVIRIDGAPNVTVNSDDNGIYIDNIPTGSPVHLPTDLHNECVINDNNNIIAESGSRRNNGFQAQQRITILEDVSDLSLPPPGYDDKDLSTLSFRPKRSPKFEKQLNERPLTPFPRNESFASLTKSEIREFDKAGRKLQRKVPRYE